MKNIYWLAPLGVLLAIQLIQPDQTNPPVNPALEARQVLQVPAEVQNTLKEACYDCHSNETQYPWYSQVAPVSWWLNAHIKEGREHLNFSTIGALSANDRAEVIGEAAEAVQEAEMPLKSYTWTHLAARLSAEQRSALANWLNANGGDAFEGGERDEEADD